MDNFEIRRMSQKRISSKKNKKNPWMSCGLVHLGILGFLVCLSQIVSLFTVLPQLKDTTNPITQNTLRRQQQQQQQRNQDAVDLQPQPVHLEIVRTDDSEGRKEEEEKKRIMEPDSNLLKKELDPRVGPLMELADIPVTDDLVRELPQWEDIDKMYDVMDGPKIVGLETCPVFMEKWRDSSDVYIAPAGLFDTGTNMLARLLRRNCIFDNDPRKPARSMHFQVPWGKHNPQTAFRFHHICEEDSWHNVKIPQERVLPVVMIKDPYTWMSSICRHKYYTNWPHTKQHCPNLQPDKTDVLLFSEHRGVKPNEAIPVRVHFSEEIRGKYASMTDMWNDWNNEYLHTASKGGEEFPRVMVRYEDLLYHPVQVITELCTCFEGRTRENFVLITDSAKGNEGVHKDSHGYKDAFIRYSNEIQRLDGYHTQDLDYAKQTLDQDLMDLFGYKHPSSSLIDKHIHPHDEYTGPFPIP